MEERRRKIKKIKFLVFHRESSQMENLLRKALESVDLDSLSDEDIDSMLSVVSLYDIELEELLRGSKDVPDEVKKGLKVLKLI